MTDSPLPLFDLARQWPSLREEALDTIDRIASAGAFSLGEELSAFETEFAQYCGSAHCVGVANGTVAIELALRALEVGPGDEVVTVAHTFVATVEAIAATGARPVFVDVDPRTRCMDTDALEDALTPRTAAVVPVHLYGRPAPMTRIRAICTAAGVAVVEDAAQAHGATVDGVRCGASGRMGALSFYPTKNLGGMGDGGAVVTDDPALAAAVRSLRHHGSAPGDANLHERPGRTERLDNLQAALLRLKLRRLDDNNDERRRAAAWYCERLAGVPLTLPAEDPAGAHQVFHLFVIEVDDRDAVLASMRAQGVGVGVHYPVPVHMQPAWRHLGYQAGDLPATERLARRSLSLPLFPGIAEAELERVARTLEGALETDV